MNKLFLSLSLSALLMPFAARSNPMVELYTSQGCYSCPPADEFLGELIEKHPEVVALEFHVDYWDDLHYGSAGVWKDPFSNPEYTARQWLYSRTELDGRRGVYTPQMIVNGSNAQVGTSKGAVLQALQEQTPTINLAASVSENLLTVDVDGGEERGSTLWLAIFDRVHTTDVPNGENHGKTMVNYNVVRELISLKQWQGDKANLSFQLPENVGVASSDNRTCAVFLQDETLGQIRGAAYCEAI